MQIANLKQVLIFCGGSSRGNGQDASRAAAVALLGYRGYWRAVGEYLGKATNQQAEIAAAAVGLESLTQPCQVNVFTDSRYVVETMNGRFVARQIFRGGSDSTAPPLRTRFTGNGLAGTPVTCYRKRQTMPRAGSQPQGRLTSRSCAMPWIKSAQ